MISKTKSQSFKETINKVLTTVTKKRERDFPGGLVVETLHFQCREPRFYLWLGNHPTCCMLCRTVKILSKVYMYNNIL